MLDDVRIESQNGLFDCRMKMMIVGIFIRKLLHGTLKIDGRSSD